MTSEKRTKLDKIIAKLNKLIAHFDNANPNEAHNAFLKSTKLLNSAELDWRDYSL